jgi:hypothetical protein
MSRVSTGLSKKINRQKTAALNLCWTWRSQFGVGVHCSPEFAWVVSDGKFGSKPAEWGMGGGFRYTESPATVDTFAVALYIIKKEGSVA